MQKVVTGDAEAAPWGDFSVTYQNSLLFPLSNRNNRLFQSGTLPKVNGKKTRRILRSKLKVLQPNSGLGLIGNISLVARIKGRKPARWTPPACNCNAQPQPAMINNQQPPTNTTQMRPTLDSTLRNLQMYFTLTFSDFMKLSRSLLVESYFGRKSRC